VDSAVDIPRHYSGIALLMRVIGKERHRTGRIGWLRAAVLGANDGILSTSSLVLGVAAAHATHSNVLVAGVARAPKNLRSRLHDISYYV
jgi:VIT1/CCC1 family predicted Fe2+/Mn2+ transporter